MPEPVGLIPACGRATRLALAAGSKELLPAGRPPRPAIHWLLGGMRQAGVERAAVVLRPEKSDLLAALRGDAACGVDLAFLTLADSPSVPHTLARAAAWLGEARVLFGFPDILFEPADALRSVARAQERGGADVVLGLVPTDRPDKADLVETDGAGRLRSIRSKPGPGPAGMSWMHAAWSPAFTRFLARFAGEHPGGRVAGRELQVADALRAALAQGLRIECIEVPGARYLDVGTPEDLARSGGFSSEAIAPRPGPG